MTASRRWWLRLASYARPYRRDLALICWLVLVTVALEALRPWPLKLIVDYVLAGAPMPEWAGWLAALPGARDSAGLLAWLAVGTVAVYAAGRAVQTAKAYVQSGVGARLVAALGADVFDHVQRLGMGFRVGASAGDLVRRVTTDCACVRELVIGVSIPLLTSLAALTVMFVIMWRLDPVLSAVAIAAAMPLGLLVRLMAGKLTERTYEQQESEGRIMALAEQTLSSLPVVQAFGRERHEDDRFRGRSGSAIRASLRATAAQVQFKLGIDTATAAGVALVMIVGGYRVLDGALSVGSLLVFMAYVASLYGPVEDLVYLSSSFATASGRARRVFDLLDRTPQVRDAPDAVDAPSLRRGVSGHVCMEGVSFGYRPGTEVLHDIDLEARPGETVALVGATGAGKSTLVSLIPRFFDPSQGRVMLDGVDVRTLRLADLRARIALVLQESLLMPITVADNISYGRPGASRADVVRAAEAANAAEFVARLPGGYDAVVGERGATLSGGERQRLAIARALLKDAPVLILDEPTAALDSAAETAVLDALDRLMKDRTVFVIAHRLSTVQRADRVLVLEQGRIVETGTHDTLLAPGTAYGRLMAELEQKRPTEQAQP